MTYQLLVGDSLIPITTVQHSPLLEFIVPPTNFSRICAELESVVALLSTLSDDTVEAPGRVLDQLLGATFQSTNAKHLQPGDISVVYQATKVLMERGNVDIISGALEATSVISEVALQKKVGASSID
ncbi:unnamed protein product [Ixodes hexagonus]